MKEKIYINSPWGFQCCDTFLNKIEMAKDQLLHFQKRNDTESLRRDLEAYEEILKSKSEENAKNFLSLKMKIRDGEIDLDLKNNREIIDHMKKNKIWIDNE